MPIGIILNSLAILSGGLIGAKCGDRLSQEFKDKLNLIFACSFGAVVSAIAIPQFLIFLTLFACAKLIFPLTTPAMINDFKACGGFIMLATGLRIAKIRQFPIADMIPSMMIIWPISWFWASIILPLL